MSSKVFFVCCIAALVMISVYVYTVYSGVTSSTLSLKEAELQEISSDLSELLAQPEAVSQTKLASLSRQKCRILVTDDSLKVTCDSSDIENLTSKTLVIPATLSALRGETEFESKFVSNSLESVLSAPIVRDGNIVGTFLIIDNDLEIYKIPRKARTSLFVSSLIALVVFLLIFALVAYVLKHRISKILYMMKTSRTELNTEHIPNYFRDEISPVIDEFNSIYDQLNYVQQMRRAFVSDASHELRTPLSAIKLLCESITGTDNVDPETTKEFLQDIVLEVDRMSHTAEKLLVLSRLDNNTSAKLSPVPLSEVVRKSIIALTPFAEDKNVSIESYIEDDCIILGEMEGTNQIIGNIIDNAIKYNNYGGFIKIYVFSKNGTCHFIADDTGIGIAPEFRKQVFERFYRVDKSREHDGRGGSGLGLSIVKRNVDSFGGSIEISESVHGGSRFTVIFQSSPAEEAYI